MMLNFWNGRVERDFDINFNKKNFKSNEFLVYEYINHAHTKTLSPYS